MKYLIGNDDEKETQDVLFYTSLGIFDEMMSEIKCEKVKKQHNIADKIIAVKVSIQNSKLVKNETKLKICFNSFD